MLIIAIPKSASTSLVHTLGEIYNINAIQDFRSVSDLLIPKKFKLLGKYHSDVRELTKIHANNWVKNEVLYKQHLPPTRNNLNLLESDKKIILLREPKEIILAYWRAEKKGLHEKRKEFDGCKNGNDWLNRAGEIGLYQELVEFYDGWNNHSGQKMVITFEELIKNQQETINKISNYFGLESQSEVVKLKKYRYSNFNFFQRHAYNILNKMKRIFRE